MRRTRNPVYGYAVPWVRIPPAPPRLKARACGPSCFGLPDRRAARPVAQRRGLPAYTQPMHSASESAAWSSARPWKTPSSNAACATGSARNGPPGKPRRRPASLRACRRKRCSRWSSRRGACAASRMPSLRPSSRTSASIDPPRRRRRHVRRNDAGLIRSEPARGGALSGTFAMRRSGICRVGSRPQSPRIWQFELRAHRMCVKIRPVQPDGPAP